MNLTAILLGIINIAIVIAIIILIGLIIQWLLGMLGFPIPAQIVKIFMVIVALIALYMLVALLLGMPTVRIIGFHEDGVTGASAVALSGRTAADLS